MQSKFRFSEDQKKYLVKVFKEGEKTGIKASPEEVHQKMRQHFSPSEYVTERQIRSLFSRLTRDLKSNSLSLDEDCDDIDDIQFEVEEVATDLCNNDYRGGEWVAIRYEGNWYPGEILIAGDKVKVQCMQRVGQGSANNFIWGKEDVHMYPVEDIICTIKPPIPISRRAFGLLKEDIENIKNIF